MILIRKFLGIQTKEEKQLALKARLEFAMSQTVAR
jgi:hypothetical protein